MNEVAPMLASKTSGYTSIVKTNQRKGDAALMATISIVSAE
jgi:ribosomal protein L17